MSVTTKKLLIVESPAKAKTIEKYLDHAYEVRSSVGHIRDLPKSNKKAVSIEDGFVPHYQIIPGKEKVVSDLKKSIKEANEVILATDPDREGEAIAWHLAEVFNLKNPKRIVFNEITKPAVTEAIRHPRSIDENLRRAQEARRVLDRLFGYDLSGLIWKKLRYGLSAGRVQSPALRIVVEREREIRAFKPETFWTITAITEHLQGKISFTCMVEPRKKSEMETILSVGKSGIWSISDVKESEYARAPRPPFITSTLQQAASSRLGFSPSKTMMLAQRLYEAGHITYMRTDSTNISAVAIQEIAAHIAQHFGTAYVEQRVYKTKSKNAQEAHEAIRPTHIASAEIGEGNDQKRLYALIRNRSIASQMADAKSLKTKISARIKPPAGKEAIPDFEANGSRLLFDGWLKADSAAMSEDVMLPRVAAGDPLTLLDLSSEQRETEPPHRYTEAGLIKELEKRGIGRPSTYASIMKTLEVRGYVEKINKALHPTDTGEVVDDFVEKHFGSYISDTFTAEMEDELDDIAGGTRGYEQTLSEFYGPFAKEIKAKDLSVGKITDLGDAPLDITCPICNGAMIVKLARSGKFLSCKKFPKCTGARTESGKELEPPKVLDEKCPEDGGALIEREGRFGKFIACSNYPKCKFIKKDPAEEARLDSGVKCPACNAGTMVERRGRFGIFYSCSNYPACKNAIKAKPTGAFCPLCTALMMDGTKTIPERCSNKLCANHNPHKLAKPART